MNSLERLIFSLVFLLGCRSPSLAVKREADRGMLPQGNNPRGFRDEKSRLGFGDGVPEVYGVVLDLGLLRSKSDRRWAERRMVSPSNSERSEDIGPTE